MDTYLVHHINKYLGIIPGEKPNRFDLIAVGEYACYQKDALVFGKGNIADQPFPGSWSTVHKDSVHLTDGNQRMNEEPTLVERGSGGLPKLLGEGQGHDPSSVGLNPTDGL